MLCQVFSCPVSCASRPNAWVVPAASHAWSGMLSPDPDSPQPRLFLLPVPQLFQYPPLQPFPLPHGVVHVLNRNGVNSDLSLAQALHDQAQFFVNMSSDQPSVMMWCILSSRTCSRSASLISLPRSSGPALIKRSCNFPLTDLSGFVVPLSPACVVAEINPFELKVNLIQDHLLCLTLMARKDCAQVLMPRNDHIDCLLQSIDIQSAADGYSQGNVVTGVVDPVG